MFLIWKIKKRKSNECLDSEKCDSIIAKAFAHQQHNCESEIVTLFFFDRVWFFAKFHFQQVHIRPMKMLVVSASHFLKGSDILKQVQFQLPQQTVDISSPLIPKIISTHQFLFFFLLPKMSTRSSSVDVEFCVIYSQNHITSGVNLQAVKIRDFVPFIRFTLGVQWPLHHAALPLCSAYAKKIDKIGMLSKNVGRQKDPVAMSTLWP